MGTVFLGVLGGCVVPVWVGGMTGVRWGILEVICMGTPVELSWASELEAFAVT